MPYRFLGAVIQCHRMPVNSDVEDQLRGGSCLRWGAVHLNFAGAIRSALHWSPSESPVQFLITTILLLFSSAALAQSSAPAPDKLYAVVFQARLDSSGKIDALTVSKVIDPSSGTTKAVNVAVPQSYIAAARAFLSKRTYPTDEKQFFTYTFYDPLQPARADIDPNAGGK